MQVALPMYFPPRDALQAFWAELASMLRADGAVPAADIPADLAWPADCHAQWLEPELLLSQACGYPLVTQLAGKVQLVGTFAYDAPGVQGIACRSQLICRAGDRRSSLQDFAGSRLALNDTVSQSGYNALRALVAGSTKAPQPFFGQRLQTGAHYRSIEAVRQGLADMAAVDAVSWALWQRSHPLLTEGLRVFAQTDAYPGLPLITSLQTPPEVLAAMRRALHRIATEPVHAALRVPLLISGFEVTTLHDYQRCLDMESMGLACAL